MKPLRPKEALVLVLLAKGEQLGLDLVKASGGELHRGTIYLLLGRMEDAGLVTARFETVPTIPGLPRARYRLTPAARDRLRLVEEN